MNVKTTTKGKMTISLTKPEHELLMRSSVTVGALARVGDKDAADAAALLSRIRSRYEKPFVIEPETKPSNVGAGESSGENQADPPIGATSPAGEPGADDLLHHSTWRIGPGMLPDGFTEQLAKCQGAARVRSLLATYEGQTLTPETANAIRLAANRRIAEIEATKV